MFWGSDSQEHILIMQKKVIPIITFQDSPFSNIEIVSLAVYILGGSSRYIDTEDIAVKANEIAPGRFAWRKYPDQINIENIRKRLSDAKNPKKGGYLLGSFKKGWILSEKGLRFCSRYAEALKKVDLSRVPRNKKEIVWQRRERERMLSTLAFEKVSLNEEHLITTQEAEDFFRVDDYVTGVARKEKLARIINTFGEDPELGQAIKLLKEKVRKI